jgi:hypothetical protein
MMPEVADMAAGTQSAGAAEMRARKRTATKAAAQASAETTAEMTAAAAEMASTHSTAHMAAASPSVSAATTAASRQYRGRERHTAESDRRDRGEDDIPYHRSLLSIFSVQPILTRTAEQRVPSRGGHRTVEKESISELAARFRVVGTICPGLRLIMHLRDIGARNTRRLTDRGQFAPERVHNVAIRRSRAAPGLRRIEFSWGTGGPRTTMMSNIASL